MSYSASIDRLLLGLDPNQIEAVCSDARVLRVIAGPGSGKTRVLTSRIAYRILTGTAQAQRCLAVTFTRSAAAELRQRLTALAASGTEHLGNAVSAGTIHSIALAMLKQYWSDASSGGSAVIDRDELLGRLVSAAGSPGLPSSIRISDASLEIGWAKARQLTFEQYSESATAMGRLDTTAARRLGEFMAFYESEKKRKRVIDFDDILVHCAAALESDSSFATRQRWRLRHLFIDETQDLTPLQFHLIGLWIGDDPDLFVVGDPRQSIYSWSGADSGIIDSLDGRFGSATTVYLDKNYRSCSELVACARSFEIQRLADTMAAAESVRGPAGTSPLIHRSTDDYAEAKLIAKLLSRERDVRVSWSSMGVLTRTNAQLPIIASALTSAGIPIAGDKDNEKGVTLSTFHKAKGKEWQVVVLAGAEDGLIPSSESQMPEEEARLFFVAITRASRQLHITWCESRSKRQRSISPYLEALGLDSATGRAGSTEASSLQLEEGIQRLKAIRSSLSGKKS
ncbi:MAG TPA: ATP-dependent helicase [Acidimicrobiales bacterium]|nr:ATP-dependent helicase [Acidimicrobiales bacterium]